MTIRFGNSQITLLPDHALIYRKTLILADTHFGKSASFRARGIPVPEGETSQDCTRILDLLEHHQLNRLIIAGDFLHAPEGKSAAVLESLTGFFNRLNCEAHLVLGNHDRRAGRLPADWPVAIHESLDLDDLLIVHDPADAPEGRFSISGHLHPVARIRDGKKNAFRTPCFWIRNSQLILPSFGTFTGGVVVHPAPNDRIFAPLPKRVVEIPLSVL